jgi:hypothetical protein
LLGKQQACPRNPSAPLVVRSSLPQSGPGWPVRGVFIGWSEVGRCDGQRTLRPSDDAAVGIQAARRRRIISAETSPEANRCTSARGYRGWRSSFGRRGIGKAPRRSKRRICFGVIFRAAATSSISITSVVAEEHSMADLPAAPVAQHTAARHESTPEFWCIPLRLLGRTPVTTDGAGWKSDNSLDRFRACACRAHRALH